MAIIKDPLLAIAMVTIFDLSIAYWSYVRLYKKKDYQIIFNVVAFLIILIGSPMLAVALVAPHFLPNSELGWGESGWLGILQGLFSWPIAGCYILYYLYRLLVVLRNFICKANPKNIPSESGVQ